AWNEKLRAEADQFAKQKQEHDNALAQLTQRSSALEGQQAMLAGLRTRLERMREDLRRDQQRVTEQEARLAAAEADLQGRAQEAEQLRAELEAARQGYENERRQFDGRQGTLKAAVAQLRQVQDTIAAREKELELRAQEVGDTAARHAEESSQLQARA